MTALNPEIHKDVAVSKIVVQLGKKELILDVEDAKALKDVLNELFGQVIVEKAPQVEKHTIIEKHYHDRYVSNPYYWNYPAVTYQVSGGLTGITCSTGNSYSFTGSSGVINCAMSSTLGTQFVKKDEGAK